MDTTTEPDINELRQEIDHLDAEILRLVQRRVEISKIIGAARMAAGGTKIVHNREIDVLNRYKPLGTEGKDLAMILLKMGRGRSAGRNTPARCQMTPGQKGRSASNTREKSASTSWASSGT